MLKLRRNFILISLFWVFAFFWTVSQQPFSSLFATSNDRLEEVVTPFTHGEKLSKLKKDNSKDTLQLAYVTTEMSKEIISVCLETGSFGKSIKLDFSAKLLTFIQDGKSVFVADQENLRIVKVDLKSGEIKFIKAPAEIPQRLVVSSANEVAYAIYAGKNEIVKLDLINETYETLVALKLFPESLVLNSSRSQLYISFQDSAEIFSFNTKTEALLPFVQLDNQPEALTLSRDGKKLFAVNEGASLLTCIDIASKEMKSVNLDTIQDGLKADTVKVNFKENTAYFAKERGSEIYKVNLQSEKLTAVVTFEDQIQSIEFYPEQELLASFTVESVEEGEPAYFDASSTNSLRKGEINYFWDFGDGLSSVTETPITEHIYEKEGEYLTTLKAIQTATNDSINAVKDNSQFVELVSTTVESLEIFKKFARDGPKLDKSAVSPEGGTRLSTTKGTPSQSSIIFGQSISDSAVVTGDAIGGTPTGTVTFYFESTQIGTPVTLVPGPDFTATAVSATYTPSTVGNFQLTAVYSGDTVYDISEDATPTNTFTVSQATSTTTLSTSSNPTVFGQSVNLIANVVIDTVSNSIATGTVTFYDGGVAIGSPVTLISGTATLSVSNFSVGAHNLRATYNGDTNFAGSDSNFFTQTVSQAVTSTTIQSSTNPAVFGNSTTLLATVTSPTATPTGTITFKDGTTTLGTVALTGNTASLPVSLSVGTHSLTATFNANTSFLTSVSPALSQQFTQGTTSTFLESSVNPSTYGQSTTFKATVSVLTGVGTPGGFYSFFSDGSLLGTAPIVAGSASFSVSTLTVSAGHAIRAVYSADTNFSTSEATLSQVVNKATPIVTVASSAILSNYGSEVIFTSTVQSPTTLGNPTGTVSFLDGTLVIGTGTLSPTGANISTATFTTKILTGGAHNITARYETDVNFATQTSAPITQNVERANTTTLIYTSSTNPTEIGEPIILRANIIGSVTNPPAPPTGTVTFYDGATPIASNIPVTTLSSNTGTVTYTLPIGLSLGNHILTAVYSSDVNYKTSTSNLMTQRVVNTTTMTTVVTSQTPAVIKQMITFTATVNSNIPGGGSPPGIVQFYSDTELLGPGTLVPNGPNSSTATITVDSLTLGSHQIKALYAGDGGNYTSSTSPRITQIINKANTTPVLSSTLNPSQFGDSITLSAQINPVAPGGGIPTGTVRFLDGTTLLGTGTINASGVATFTTIALYPGTHPINAQYSGDLNYIASTNAIPYSQVVQNKLATTVSIISSRNSSPVTEAVTYTVRVSAITGIPTGTVQFYDSFTGSLVPIGGPVTLNTTTGTANITEAAALMLLGNHPITAVYSGDANFFASNNNATPLIQRVVPFNTTTTLITAPNPSSQSNATFTATVVPSAGAPTLTGTVIFYDGDTAISPALAVPANGIVSFNPIDLHFGALPIRAVYSGDTTNFATSTSNTVIHYVQQTDMLTTRTTLTTSLATSYFCQSINLTATVVNLQGFYLPTGTVTFFDGSVEIGSAILNNSGVAVLAVDSLSVGVHTLNATYNSDSNYAFSFSNSVQQTVVVNPTAIALTCIPNATTTPYGQELTFVATVTSTFGTPTGVVTFSDETGELDTVPLDSTGKATYTTDSTEVGSHIFTAVYDPSCCSTTACFGAATATLPHNVTPISARLVLNATPSPATYGDIITLNANVSAYFVGEPEGNVTFYQGNTLLGTSPIVQGLATFDVPRVQAGNTIFRATYNGDNNFISSNFPSFLEVVNKAQPQAALVGVSSNPSKYGEPVTLTATVISYTSTPTGTVTFFNGATNLGTVNLDVTGITGFSVSTLPIGTNSITARYNGDANFLVTTAPAFIQNVIKADTITTVTSTAPSPSVFGSPVTINVSVKPDSPGSGVPTGTVSGFLGSVSLGTAQLNNGVASFSSTVLPVGTQTITVRYAGDTLFNASSGLVTQTVSSAPTTISTLTSSNNPSVFGQSVNFTTRVTSTAGTPTGTVSFLDGTTELGVATLDSNGNASISRSTLTVGTHPITTRYTATGNFSSSTSSSTLNQVVNRAATTTTIASTVLNSVYGQPVTFTATVVPNSPGSGTPTGTVTFFNGTTALSTVPLGVGGIVSFTTSSLQAQSAVYPIKAVYNVSTNFATSESAALQQTVSPVSTITSVTSTVNPSSLGQLVQFNVTVNAINTGIVIPGGTVTATYGSTVIGTGQLDPSGKISFLTSSLPAGTLPVNVTYAGNSNFSSSTTTLDQTVIRGTSSITLGTSLTPSRVGQNVTFTATVTGGSGVPTGTVAFFDGTTQIGTQSLIAGVATLTTSSLALGSHTIRATYNGDSNYAIITSSPITQVVQQAVTSTALTTSISPTFFGQQTIFSATVNVTTGSGTPTGNVEFREGTTLIGTVPLSGGNASLPYSLLTVGTKTITATYVGDTNFLGSGPAPVTQDVNAAVSTTTLTSSPNPSTFGAPVSLTAAIAISPGTGTAAGSVEFRVGTTSLGVVQVTAGQATLSVSTLALNSNALSAIFTSTDANIASSTGTATHQVNPASSTVVMTTSPNPSLFGQSVNYVATVSVGTSPTPATGTVEFYEGATSFGSATLVGGVATLSYADLSIGNHTLFARFTGNANYTAANSPNITQVVNPVTTTTVVGSSSNPILVNSPLTLTATVQSTVGSKIPTGTISFRDGTTGIGTVTLVNGTASITTSALTAGSHSITALYISDSNFVGSVSGSFNQVIDAAQTTTTLTSSQNPSTFGQETIFQATVTSASGSPTGSVTFRDGSTVIGTATIIGNTATLSVSDLSVQVAPHVITAVYNGDTSFLTSTSAPVQQQVNKALSVTSILAATPNPSLFGQSVAFFATVTTNEGFPTGTVTFYDGAVALGTVNVSDGIAIFTTQSLAVGTHPITATYSGDNNYQVSSSTPPYSQVVNQITTTETTVINLVSLTNPSSYGNPVVFDVTVTPINLSGVPTGFVTLFSGAVPLGTQSLVNGFTSFTINGLPAGTSTIVALYSGDDDYSSSTKTLSQVVTPIATTSSLDSSLNPSAYLQPVTFSSTITSTTGAVPSGSVSFYDGTVLLGTTTVNNIGVATIIVSNLSTGTHSINAIFNPDQNFVGSQDLLVQDVVESTTTTTILTSSPNPSEQGASVTFIGSVGSPNGNPTGTVNVFDGATFIGSAPVFNGLVIFNTSSLAVGSRSITFEYIGSPEFSLSTSAPFIQVVEEPTFATTIVVSSSQNPAEMGVPVTLTATVSSSSGTPTGTVTFYDGSNSLGSSLLINGVAQLTVSTFSTGNHPITAIYSGDADFSPSTSDTFIEVISASSVPSVPQDFFGCQVINKYLNTDEIVNILTWTPPQDNASIIGYEIYRDAALTNLVGVVDNQCPYRIEDGNRKKKVTYEYFLVSVNAQGIRSPAVKTVVIPHKKSSKRRFEFIDSINDVLRVEE